MYGDWMLFAAGTLALLLVWMLVRSRLGGPHRMVRQAPLETSESRLGPSPSPAERAGHSPTRRDG